MSNRLKRGPLVIAVAIALSLAGCGGGSSSDEGSEPRLVDNRLTKSQFLQFFKNAGEGVYRVSATKTESNVTVNGVPGFETNQSQQKLKTVVRIKPSASDPDVFESDFCDINDPVPVRVDGQGLDNPDGAETSNCVNESYVYRLLRENEASVEYSCDDKLSISTVYTLLNPAQPFDQGAFSIGNQGYQDGVCGSISEETVTGEGASDPLKRWQLRVVSPYQSPDSGNLGRIEAVFGLAGERRTGTYNVFTGTGSGTNFFTLDLRARENGSAVVQEDSAVSGSVQVFVINDQEAAAEYSIDIEDGSGPVTLAGDILLNLAAPSFSVED